MSAGPAKFDERKPGFFSDLMIALLNMSAIGSSAHPDVQKELLGFGDDTPVPGNDNTTSR